MNNLVLIPSAKLIPIELQAEFGSIPSAMIPINSKPVINYIIEFYKGDEYIIAVNEERDLIENYFSKFSDKKNISIVDVGNSNNIGETIYSVLSKLDKSKPCNLIINFADTLLKDDIIISGDFVLYAELKDLYRWTTFTLDKENKIVSITEKNIHKEDKENKLAFIGVFGIGDYNLFSELLSNELLKKNLKVDPFYTTLLRYYNHMKDVKFFKVEQWYDFGHIDTYYETKKKMDERCREFNSLTVDSVRGVITKRSNKVEKFIGEIEWYLKLPAKIKYMAPRVFDYSLDYVSPYVSLEYYGYPALNDLYLFGNLDLGSWSRIFDSIEKVLNDMREFRVEPEDDSKLVNSIKTIYEIKTIQRIKEYIDDPKFDHFRHRDNNKYLTLDKIIELIPIVLEKNNIYKEPFFSIIHGDFCLSNILYDRRNRIVRLIDPRGKFGEFDIYGDYLYDIAKLCHSFLGDYDFLVNGLFSLNKDGNGYQLNIFTNKMHENIKKLFYKKFMSLDADVTKKIRIIESLLFLSMVPLHYDRPDSQIAFVIRGMELFEKYAGESL